MIHVVAGAVIDAVGRVLIAQRPPGKHLAGGWEFPGGKLEPGETRAAGLTRELREELGIALTGHPRPLIRVRHTYPYGEVLIDMWVVSRYEGEPQGMDGQAIRWLTLDELETADLLPADRPIVRVLRLPARVTDVSTRAYRIVDSRSPPKRSAAHDDAAEPSTLVGAFCRDAEQAFAAATVGADFMVLTERLADVELAALCESISVPVFARAVGLEQAWALGATGVSEIQD